MRTEKSKLQWLRYCSIVTDAYGKNPQHYEYAVVLSKDFRVAYNMGDTPRVILSMYVNDKERVTFRVDPQNMPNDGPDAHLPLNERILLRLSDAFEKGTDADFRFCTGEPKKRKREQDNLHPDYDQIQSVNLLSPR